MGVQMVPAHGIQTLPPSDRIVTLRIARRRSLALGYSDLHYHSGRRSSQRSSPALGLEVEGDVRRSRCQFLFFYNSIFFKEIKPRFVPSPKPYCM
jgi:hypothetical protein